ncbi:hypothetical protein LSTR_LSTR002716 [Laodelphax striatellus]|uniref:Uncharacterized protein n=1 Tax=Laodelphax striatellus TaxID=195883 RepID=A0A482X5N0_LAOST|nr:hypothetical protein LSTR_LSTR002716 [Laodelphax striatellus]
MLRGLSRSLRGVLEKVKQSKTFIHRNKCEVYSARKNTDMLLQQVPEVDLAVQGGSTPPIATKREFLSYNATELYVERNQWLEKRGCGRDCDGDAISCCATESEPERGEERIEKKDDRLSLGC